jgi:hypothetical protein
LSNLLAPPASGAIPNGRFSILLVGPGSSGQIPGTIGQRANCHFGKRAPRRCAANPERKPHTLSPESVGRSLWRTEQDVGRNRRVGQLLGRRGCAILYLGPAREVSLVQLRENADDSYRPFSSASSKPADGSQGSERGGGFSERKSFRLSAGPGNSSLE